MIQNIRRIVRRNWRRLGLKLGFIKQPVVYEVDPHVAHVINKIVNSPEIEGAYVVAVETRQAALKIMSYMSRNRIEAVAVSGLIDGDSRFPSTFRQSCLVDMVLHMRSDPSQFRVVVVNKNVAASGWRVPPEYHQYWGPVHMLTTFTPRNAGWIEQFNGRVRRVS